MPLNRAVLLFTLLISSYGLLEDTECDASSTSSCDVDQQGKTMLQAGRDFKKHDTLKTDQSEKLPEDQEEDGHEMKFQKGRAQAALFKEQEENAERAANLQWEKEQEDELRHMPEEENKMDFQTGPAQAAFSTEQKMDAESEANPEWEANLHEFLDMQDEEHENEFLDEHALDWQREELPDGVEQTEAASPLELEFLEMQDEEHENEFVDEHALDWQREELPDGVEKTEAASPLELEFLEMQDEEHENEFLDEHALDWQREELPDGVEQTEAASPLELEFLEMQDVDEFEKQQAALLSELKREAATRDKEVGQIPTEAIQSKCSFINSDTNAPAQIVGEVPQGNGPWPLAVYLQGTYTPWASGVATAFHQQMAQRSFYSISIQYNNMEYQNGGSCEMFKTKAGNVAGCINTLCNQSIIDCSLGVAMYGWSQGGQVSSLVGNYTNFPVTAWLGFSATYINYLGTREEQEECLKLKVPTHKRRLLMGANDGLMGGNGSAGSGNVTVIIEGAKEVTDPPSCTTSYDCIQEDGSGYYVGTTAETGLVMYHWWFIQMSGPNPGTLQDVFVNPPDPSVEWGEKTVFDWLATAALTSN